MHECIYSTKSVCGTLSLQFIIFTEVMTEAPDQRTDTAVVLF